MLVRFHSFYPLETLEQKRNPPKVYFVLFLHELLLTNLKVFTFSSFMYKCISSIDGHPYAIRRIDGLRIVHEAAILQITGTFHPLIELIIIGALFNLTFLEIWRGIQHPNIVTLRDLFTGKDSNGCSGM